MISWLLEWRAIGDNQWSWIMMMVMTAMVSVAMHPPVFHSCESPAFSLKAALDDYHDWDYIPIIVIEIIIFILIFIDRDYSENRDYEATKGSIGSTSLLVPKPNPTSCTQYAHCASVQTLSIEAFSDILPFYYFFLKVSAHLWEANIISLIFYFFNDIPRSLFWIFPDIDFWYFLWCFRKNLAPQVVAGFLPICRHCPIQVFIHTAPCICYRIVGQIYFPKQGRKVEWGSNHY